MNIREHIKFVFTLFVLPIIPAFLLYRHNYIKITIVVIAAFWLLSLICLFSKKLAESFKHLLSVVGSFLGRYIAIVALFFVYICTVLPTGLLMKVVKRDRLKLKKGNTNSYWVDCNSKNSGYEYQF